MFLYVTGLIVTFVPLVFGMMMPILLEPLPRAVEQEAVGVLLGIFALGVTLVVSSYLADPLLVGLPGSK